MKVILILTSPPFSSSSSSSFSLSSSVSSGFFSNTITAFKHSFMLAVHFKPVCSPLWKRFFFKKFILGVFTWIYFPEHAQIVERPCVWLKSIRLFFKFLLQNIENTLVKWDHLELKQWVYRGHFGFRGSEHTNMTCCVLDLLRVLRCYIQSWLLSVIMSKRILAWKRFSTSALAKKIVLISKRRSCCCRCTLESLDPGHFSPSPGYPYASLSRPLSCCLTS